MSGNASRKYKQLKERQERKLLFGELGARDEMGRLDLVAFGASQGKIITGSARCDPGKVTVYTKKKNGRKLKNE